MPTLLNKKGFRFFFYSNEGNEPPHVHVIGHGGEAKIWLQTAEYSTFYNLSPPQLKWIKTQVKQNMLSFMEAWNATFKRG